MGELQPSISRQLLQLSRAGQHALDALKHIQTRRWAAAYAAGILVAGSFAALEYTDTIPNLPTVQEPICLPGDSSSMRTNDSTLEVSLTPDCFYPRVGLVRAIHVYQVRQGHTDYSHTVANSMIPAGTTYSEIADIYVPKPSFVDVYLSPDATIIKLSKQDYTAQLAIGTPGP